MGLIVLVIVVLLLLGGGGYYGRGAGWYSGGSPYGYGMHAPAFQEPPAPNVPNQSQHAVLCSVARRRVNANAQHFVGDGRFDVPVAFRSARAGYMKTLHANCATSL